MSQTTTAVPPEGQAPAGPPPLVVNAQYVKDLSFEVPGAPQIYQRLRTAPQVGINLDVQVRKLQDTGGVYEVGLVIRAEAREATAQNSAPNPPTTAEAAGLAVFIAELTYAGVFTLTGIADNAIEPVLLVECPRLLFPYARNLLGEVTREGGFPPVLLQPIDFVALWQSRRAQTAAQASVPAGNAVA